ncbi:polysaccharide deacetylase family protein [Terrilactibacillus laevilacticus]|uniref:polysaccharide deacetylase family protein n=1 Tax=Terrilactibacillus laevilacticus TaxID=1380157 RepID=UPI001146CEDF|nr:polysaccharide deacetylase family protein [Terrilactibacillus laevilacticus]
MLHILFIVLTIISLFIVYSIIPTIAIRSLSIGIFQRSHTKGQASLTFDDGPDQLYTPMLLDLFKKHNVKATFFVVGEHAKKNPDIIKRMHEEGHTIGIHHYKHVSNWFLMPWQIRKQCKMTADLIESIIGERPIYYRPPWGHLNLFIHWGAKPFRLVLWSAILGDWKLSLGKDRLKKRLQEHIKDGAVIVLHDNGENPGADERAPENTISAVTEYLEENHGKYEFVSIHTLYEDEHRNRM